MPVQLWSATQELTTMKKQNGVLIGRGEYDWVAGGNSPIQYEVNVRDWKTIPLEHEIQFNYNALYDSLMCVTYSALKGIGKLLSHLIQEDYINSRDLIWLKENGYFRNNKLNFSERFTGTLGETTSAGAYQYKVANAIRQYGLIPQGDFELAGSFNDNIDKKFITDAHYKKGKEFIKRFPINWEWVNDESRLNSFPLQTIVTFANYEKETDILKPAGTLNHAVVLVQDRPSYNEIEDSYNQRYKRYGKGYTHSYMSYSITINDNNMNVEKFIKDNDTNIIRNTNTGAYGVIYSNRLMEIKGERAGLFMIDREARGLIGKSKMVAITDKEWQEIKEAGLIVNF